MLCSVMVFYVLGYFVVVLYAPLAVMLHALILCSCGALFCVVSALSGQCVASASVSVICHVLCDYYVPCA